MKSNHKNDFQPVGKNLKMWIKIKTEKGDSFWTADFLRCDHMFSWKNLEREVTQPIIHERAHLDRLLLRGVKTNRKKSAGDLSNYPKTSESDIFGESRRSGCHIKFEVRIFLPLKKKLQVKLITSEKSNFAREILTQFSLKKGHQMTRIFWQNFKKHVVKS